MARESLFSFFLRWIGGYTFISMLAQEAYNGRHAFFSAAIVFADKYTSASNEYSRSVELSDHEVSI